jgi:hypothetical protein
LKILLKWIPFLHHPLSLSRPHKSLTKQREGKYQLQKKYNSTLNIESYKKQQADKATALFFSREGGIYSHDMT